MSGETDTQPFRVDSATHRALGSMRTLSIGSGPTLSLTHQEAETLCLALAAVRDGMSQEPEIYLSPIASDHGFCARVGAQGVEVETPTGLEYLDWPAVSRLIRALTLG